MISKGCRIRTIAALRAFDGLTLAMLFIIQKEDALARTLLAGAKRTVGDALKAELMKEKVAHAITGGIDETLAALDKKDYEKADESILGPHSWAMEEALQQAVKCEVWEPLRKAIEERERRERGEGGKLE